jgi:hypothetical protein
LVAQTCRPRASTILRTEYESGLRMATDKNKPKAVPAVIDAGSPEPVEPTGPLMSKVSIGKRVYEFDALRLDPLFRLMHQKGKLEMALEHVFGEDTFMRFLTDSMTANSGAVSYAELRELVEGMGEAAGAGN